METNWRENAETKTRLKTPGDVQKFFEDCKKYWMRQGDSASVATCKAFWWDCVEAWNFDRCWNEAKEKFAMDFRAYKPGDPVPDAKIVEEGGI